MRPIDPTPHSGVVRTCLALVPSQFPWTPRERPGPVRPAGGQPGCDLWSSLGGAAPSLHPSCPVGRASPPPGLRASAPERRLITPRYTKPGSQKVGRAPAILYRKRWPLDDSCSCKHGPGKPLPSVRFPDRATLPIARWPLMPSRRLSANGRPPPHSCQQPRQQRGRILFRHGEQIRSAMEPHGGGSFS